jgi:hypothetical protein
MILMRMMGGVFCYEGWTGVGDWMDRGWDIPLRTSYVSLIQIRRNFIEHGEKSIPHHNYH